MAAVRHPGWVANWKQRAVAALERAHATKQAMADKRDRDRGVVRLTVMADYACSGIWKGRAGGPVTPEELGLSAALCERVRRWSEAYQNELQGTDVRQWSREGPEIAAAIQAELGPDAKVDYRSNEH